MNDMVLFISFVSPNSIDQMALELFRLGHTISFANKDEVKNYNTPTAVITIYTELDYIALRDQIDKILVSNNIPHHSFIVIKKHNGIAWQSTPLAKEIKKPRKQVPYLTLVKSNQHKDEK